MPYRHAIDKPLREPALDGGCSLTRGIDLYTLLGDTKLRGPLAHLPDAMTNYGGGSVLGAPLVGQARDRIGLTTPNGSSVYWDNAGKALTHANYKLTMAWSANYSDIESNGILIELYNNRCRFQRNSTNNYYQWNIASAGADAMVPDTGWGPADLLGEWHDYLITYDGANKRLYIDGGLRCTDPRTGGAAGADTDSLTIGGIKSTSFEANGQVGYVVIWNRPLPAAEAIAFQRDPYQIFRPERRLRLVSAAAAPPAGEVSATSGSVAVTARNAAVNEGAGVATTRGTTTITARNASVTAGQSVSTTRGTATITGRNAAINAATTVAANLAAVTITARPAAVSVVSGEEISATPAAIAITGRAASVSGAAAVSATVGAGVYYVSDRIQIRIQIPDE